LIDIHCHILPAVDDGPANFAESLDMARIASKDGIKTIVATPHVMDAGLQPEKIASLTRQVNKRLTESDVDLVIVPGSDVNVLLEQDLFRSYTIAGTSYVLIEFPHAHLPPNARQMIFQLVASGLRPVVTHPERNGSIIRDPFLAKGLVESGGLIQVTAGSLTGEFGPEVRQCAMGLLKKGLVHFLATDAHSPRWRPPILSEGLKVARKVIGKTRALALVHENPKTLLANGRLQL